jgi:hypothetical protein
MTLSSRSSHTIGSAPGQDGRLPGQPRQELGIDRIKLTDMPEGEGAQRR